MQQFAILLAGRLVIDGRQVAEHASQQARAAGFVGQGRGRRPVVGSSTRAVCPPWDALLVQDARQQQHDFSPFGQVQPRGRAPEQLSLVAHPARPRSPCGQELLERAVPKLHVAAAPDDDSAVQFLGGQELFGAGEGVAVHGGRGELVGQGFAGPAFGDLRLRIPSGCCCMANASSCSRMTVRSAFSRSRAVPGAG